MSDEMSDSIWRLLGGGDSEGLGERGRFGRLLLCVIAEGRCAVEFALLILGIVAFEVDEVDGKACLLVLRGWADAAFECLLAAAGDGEGFEDEVPFKDVGTEVDEPSAERGPGESVPELGVEVEFACACFNLSLSFFVGAKYPSKWRASSPSKTWPDLFFLES